jgi:arabinan endo-1,5-alpha-L-arabinosidase
MISWLQNNMKNNFNCACILAIILLAASCSKDTGSHPPPDPPDTTTPPPATFDINSITDTYAAIAPFAYHDKWSVYNVHDPSVLKDGDWYYMYSTDVGYGIDVRSGIQVRKSKDLVEWQFVGWVFDDLPKLASNFIKASGGTPNNSLWAPYIMKVGSEYRLYYSLASNAFRVSCIGLATASSPTGPWTEKGLAVTSTDGYPGTNAIDPTVVTTPSGDMWMVYGSAWDGLFELKLDASTGFAAASGDKGKRIVRRGITGGVYNGNLEGAELIYNSALKKYYLFVAYDWIDTKYNVRVFRSSNPDGPFLDYNDADVDNQEDNGPMIEAPYQFSGHGGWQGTSHCGVFKDGSGQYYIANQGRPSVDKYYMDLHLRKIFWTEDGWPVVSPERYAWEDNSNVAKDSITGNWERIDLNYNVVPGYGNEQTYPDLQISKPMSIDAAGTIDGDGASTWTYAAPWLQLKFSNGTTAKVMVQKGRDWENKKSTIIFTGLNNSGIAVWGKKK